MTNDPPPDFHVHPLLHWGHWYSVFMCGEAGLMAWGAAAKTSKYRNEPCVIDGIRFQSKAEGKYYAQLKLRERAGEVDGVELQKPFAITIDGKLICTYRSDFSFYDNVEKRQRVVDVKGVSTPVFKLKAKLVKAVHGISIEVVK